jgi:hypothetical protein
LTNVLTASSSYADRNAAYFSLEGLRATSAGYPYLHPDKGHALLTQPAQPYHALPECTRACIQLPRLPMCTSHGVRGDIAPADTDGSLQLGLCAGLHPQVREWTALMRLRQRLQHLMCKTSCCQRTTTQQSGSMHCKCMTAGACVCKAGSTSWQAGDTSNLQALSHRY